MQILVLGMHRSGTSAAARLINLMGAYFGPEGIGLAAGKANPKGFWERRDVLQLNDLLLAAQSCRWDDLAHWDEQAAGHAPDQLRRLLRRLILNLDAHRPWVVKDPRLCLTLPAWLPLLEAPIAVIVYRNPLEISRSLQARNNFPFAYALALWERYSINLLNASRPLPRIFISYESLLQNPYSACETLLRQLQEYGARRLELPGKREIEAFIEPALYRARLDGSEPALSPAALHLCALLQGTASQEDLYLSPASDAILDAGLPVRA